MNQNDFYVKLNINSTVSQLILDKVKNSPDTRWHSILDQSLHRLTIDDFKDDSNISKIINDLGAHNRLSVMRLFPNVSSVWHQDKVRSAAINMLLDGFDSFCAFGESTSSYTYSNVHKLEHEPNRYYLLDVKKSHSVYNFTGMRYLVSIGLEQPYYEVVEYLNNHQFI